MKQSLHIIMLVAVCTGIQQLNAMQLLKPQLIKTLAANASALRLSRFTSSQSSGSQNHVDSDPDLRTIRCRLKEIEDEEFERTQKTITDPVEREYRTLLRQEEKLIQQNKDAFGLGFKLLAAAYSCAVLIVLNLE